MHTAIAHKTERGHFVSDILYHHVRLDTMMMSSLALL